jgi:CheY-like chemotaxis protein
MSAKRILLVDDDPLVVDFLLLLLNREGHTVEAASNAEAGLEEFLRGPFDVVITDLELPGMRGDELAAQLRRINPDQRIILISGFPPEVPPPSCDLVLGKPLSALELRAALAALESATPGEA